jgi:lipid-A-disaccharide synthase
MRNRLKIGLVAGEASGDQLGAGLIAELKNQFPEAEFVGLGGKLMQAQGLRSLFPMDRLSVMGLVEPAKRLPELLRIRRTLYHYFAVHRFDLVVGIDSPDFNLGLELKLKRSGIKTVHYVSPSVWAWRQGRIKKIARAVDHMLTLLPFEADFYHDHNVPVTFVGHPLAEELPLATDTSAARQALGLEEDKKILAVLPGSRGSEVAALGALFLDTVRECRSTIPNLHIVIPAANQARKDQLELLLKCYQDVPVTLLDGQSHQAMAAADAVLLASGTTALEAMLLKKPMVVSYRMGRLSYAIISRMLKVPYVSLPNLLAGRALVPECIQDDATVDRLTAELLPLLNSDKAEDLQASFLELHQQLQQGGNVKAASVIAGMLCSLPEKVNKA